MTENCALIIDDSRAIRLTLSRIVHSLGFDSYEFPDAESAVSWLKDKNEAILALVDWNMPGIGGLGFLTTIRGNTQFDGMAIMVITSDTSLATMEKAFALGADEYLMKPITQDSVRAKLEMLGFTWDP